MGGPDMGACFRLVGESTIAVRLMHLAWASHPPTPFKGGLLGYRVGNEITNWQPQA